MDDATEACTPTQEDNELLEELRAIRAPNVVVIPESDDEGEVEARSVAGSPPLYIRGDRAAPASPLPDDDVKEPYRADRGGRFRANAKAFLLTYTHCTATKDELKSHLERLGPIVHLVIGSEHHADGDPHLHAYVKFAAKKNIKRADFFDMRGQPHADVRPVGRSKCDHQRSAEYPLKEDPSPLIYHRLDTSTPDNFTRRLGDQRAWEFYRLSMGRRPIDWPFMLPDRSLIEKPVNPLNKRRHYWIVGRPDCGKSTWINDTFGGRAVYMRPAGVQYPFDDYNGEEVILYDDVPDVSLPELINATNTWDVLMPVFGNTRYGKRYWPPGQMRTVILCSNPPVPTFTQLNSFLARFFVIDMDAYDLSW